MRTGLARCIGLLSVACLADPGVGVFADQAEPSKSLPKLIASDGSELPFPTRERLVDFLRSASKVSSKTLSQGITGAEKVLLEADGITVHVVFHDVDRHEMRTKRLPNGNVVLHVKDSFKSQIAAYELSLLMGMDNIPPTVGRKIGASRGSAQLWIENAMTEEDRRERELDPPDRNLWNQQYADMRVFDNLINNIDRNQGNVLVDPFWKLWLIDHTRSFGHDKGLPRPELISRCSKGLWTRLRALDEEIVSDRLSPYLRKVEIQALMSRREGLIELIEEKIASNGEERVLFETGSPDPGITIRDSSGLAESE